jgi:hypothetical protein
MASTAETEPFLLVKGQYHPWKPKAISKLREAGVYLNVNGTEPKPPPPITLPGDASATAQSMHANALRDIRDWCRRDDKALGIILSLLSDAEKQSINQDAQTSKDLWDEIAARHKDENTGIAAFFIRRSIIAKRYDPDEPAPPGMTAMSVHASFYSKENKKLGPKGFEDEFLAQLLLFSLPRELNWESLSISLLRDVTEAKPLVFATVSASVAAT